VRLIDYVLFSLIDNKNNLFNSTLSRTTWLSQYEKVINSLFSLAFVGIIQYVCLLQSVASSSFKCQVWLSFSQSPSFLLFAS